MSDSRSRAIASELAKSAVVAQVTRPRVEGEADVFVPRMPSSVVQDEINYCAHKLDRTFRDEVDLRTYLYICQDWQDLRAAVTRLTAEVERLREIAEEAINAARLAWHEGYDDAVDPAWSEKQLRYAKVDAEPHEIKAVTHFFGVSDTKAWVEELSARLAALSLPTPAPEATE